MSTIIVVTIIGVVRKQEGASLNFIAMLVLFITILNDIFYYSSWISTDEFISIGLLFYLFVQAIHLAKRFSQSFGKVERLTVELQQFNTSLERKVERRTLELQNANEQLQGMEEARKRLFANVSHELNTPLTFIQGYIKAMMDGVISKDDSTYLRSIYSDTTMMARIIDDLQELSKLETGQITFEFKETSIQSFVKEIYEEQKPTIRKNNYRLRYVDNFSSDQNIKIYCMIDAMRMKQVIVNLIFNAQKYTKEKGTITIALEYFQEVDSVQISIIDTGIGITEEDLPYVFERFYKGKKMIDDEIKGAGLGLAIVKEIIELHNGKIQVKSVEEEGSTFSFTLPINRMIDNSKD